MNKRKNAEEIKKWADNKDAVVWVFVNEWVIQSAPPRWLEKNEYKTILPEYAEAWQAFLDGQLQVIIHSTDDWVDWRWLSPAFDLPSTHYRRKPKSREYWLNLDTRTWQSQEPIKSAQARRFKWLLVREVNDEKESGR